MRVLPYHLPLVAARGQGSRVWDVDGNEYIDLNMAYGPLVLGHCPEPVIRAVTDQISIAAANSAFRPKSRSASPRRLKNSSRAWS